MIQKRFLNLFLLIILLICSINLSLTYSKYILSKNITGEITVPQVDFCIRNGFNKLKDCMLVMENYSKSVESAKLYIASKGEVNDFSAYPKYNYKDDSNNYTKEDVYYNYGTYIMLGQNYTFDETTGIYYLEDYIKDEVSTNYVNYYICESPSATWCAILYKINSVEPGTSNITSLTKMTYTKLKPFNDQQIGLYAAPDDYGTSYYYRGEVKNNYVQFSDNIWKIVRQNGDGSIRLIYQSPIDSAPESEAAQGIGVTVFSEKHYSPNYVGYMQGSKLELVEGTEYFYYGNIYSALTYLFSSNYEIDYENQQFILNENTIISDTWDNVRQNSKYNGYYTCFEGGYGTNHKNCNQLFKVNTDGTYNTSYNALVKMTTFTPTSYQNNLTNEVDSQIKKVIDTWYQNNIYNKYDNYLNDNIFCNERKIFTNESSTGLGFRIDKPTLYEGFYRSKPSLKCSQLQDKFTVSTNNGNGNLTYPIGLLTIDEARYAGISFGSVNTENYLVTASNWWLMSPEEYGPVYATAGIAFINANGYISAAYAAGYAQARPVVNLKPDVKITSGDGTITNPYKLSL